MSQAGYTPIQLYYSTTAAAVPVNTNLADGELAINITDEKLYFKNAAGVVKLLASNATSAPVLSFSAGTTGFTPSTATSGAITLAGTLATTNGGTGLTAFTANQVFYASSTSAFAQSANLTFNGTTLTANTIGAFTLGGTIAGGGNQINNVIIGTTTPLAGAFTTLSATGVATFSAGTVSLPAITTSGDTNTGIFFPAADTIAFTEGGVESMRIDASGNLGLGVTPSAWGTLNALQVKNTAWSSDGNVATLTGNAYYDGSNFRYIANGASCYYQINNGGGFNWNIAASGTAGNVASFTQAMTLDASVNLGVGTTSPSQRIDATVSSSTEGSGLAVTNSLSGGYGSGINFYSIRGDTSAKVLAGQIKMIGASSWNSDGSVSSTMMFSTVNANTFTERLRIANTGAWGLAGGNYGSSGQVLTSNGSGSAPTWQAGGGGGGSPGGSNTQVQYNNSGSFAGSANFTFNGTGITTGNVNVTSGTTPTAGMYLNSTSTSGLSFYNTGALGASSFLQAYYGRSTIPNTTNGVLNGERQWLAFGSGATPKLTTIGSTASIYVMEGHGYLITDVPSVLRINSGGRGDNTDYQCPAENGVIFVDMDASYGGNAANNRAGMFIKQRQMGLGGSSTTGYKAQQEGYGSGARCFWSLCKPNDPNGGGQPFGFYSQIDTSNGGADNSAPVGLVIDNATVDNYTKTNGGAQMAIFYDRRSGSTTRTAIQFYRNTTGNSVGTISTTNTATAYNTSSDYRLKENIAPLTGAIERVLRLKPSTYTWKVDGSAGEGFIAHELQEVIPQAVSGTKDEQKLQQVEVENAVAEVQDEDGNIVSYGKPPVYEEQMKPVYQGVDTSFLVATLTAAIQEQQALIVALTARLDALEAK